MKQRHFWQPFRKVDAWLLAFWHSVLLEGDLEIHEGQSDNVGPALISPPPNNLRTLNQELFEGSRF